MLKFEEDYSFADVIAYRDDPVFSHLTKVFPTLSIPVVPGTLLAADGSAYAEGATVYIVLDKHAAGSNVPVIVVDRGCVLKRSGLRAATASALANAIAAIEADGKNRVSITNEQ